MDESEAEDQWHLDDVENKEEPDGRPHECQHRHPHLDEVDTHRRPSGIRCHRGHASECSVERNGSPIRHFRLLRPGPPIGSQAAHLEADRDDDEHPKNST